LDPHLGVGVGVHLAEQRQLDLAWEEAVLLSGEGAPPGFLDVRLRDVADEVADDADIEQELTAAALRVERERLARARQVGERDPRRPRWRGKRGGGRRRARGRLRLHPLEPLGERLELLLELL